MDISLRNICGNTLIFFFLRVVPGSDYLISARQYLSPTCEASTLKMGVRHYNRSFHLVQHIIVDDIGAASEMPYDVMSEFFNPLWPCMMS